jgi:hypothetical protein
LYGESLVSNDGNGALIQLVPDLPITLTNDLDVTSATVVKITWSDGVSNGGTAVIDYRVSYDQSIGTFVDLDSGIATQSYTTTVILTPGAFYLFRVEARNSVGFSEVSSSLQVHAA